MILRALLAFAAMPLAACDPKDRGPQWVAFEDPYGASFSYVAYGGPTIFSIGCRGDTAQVSVRELRPSETSAVSVHLADVDLTLIRVERTVAGIVAEGTLNAAWINSVARADAVSVSYAGETYGPLALPADIRTSYVERCGEVLTNPRQFP